MLYSVHNKSGAQLCAAELPVDYTLGLGHALLDAAHELNADAVELRLYETNWDNKPTIYRKQNRLLLPSFYATWLINADGSSLTEEELNFCQEVEENLGYCVGVDSEKEEYKTINGLLCHCIEYTFQK